MTMSNEFQTILLDLQKKFGDIITQPLSETTFSLIFDCLSDINALLSVEKTIHEYIIDEENPFCQLTETTSYINLGTLAINAILKEKLSHLPSMLELAKELQNIFQNMNTVLESNTADIELITTLKDLEKFIKDNITYKIHLPAGQDQFFRILSTHISSIKILKLYGIGKRLLAWANNVALRNQEKLTSHTEDLTQESQAISNSDSECDSDFEISNEQEKTVPSSAVVSLKELSEKLEQSISNACNTQAGNELITILLDIKNAIEDNNSSSQNIIDMINANIALVQSDIGKELLTWINSRPSQKSPSSTKRKIDSHDSDDEDKNNSNTNKLKRVKISSPKKVTQEETSTAPNSPKAEAFASNLIISEELTAPKKGMIDPDFLEQQQAQMTLPQSIPLSNSGLNGDASRPIEEEDDIELQIALRMSMQTSKANDVKSTTDFFMECDAAISSFGNDTTHSDPEDDDAIQMAIKLSLQDSSSQPNKSPSREQVKTMAGSLSNVFNGAVSSETKSDKTPTKES